jgi:hypothetical protein
MALQSNEVWRRGFVVNVNTGGLCMSRITTGAVAWGGFLRDPDGRLVVSNA